MIAIICKRAFIAMLFIAVTAGSILASPPVPTHFSYQGQITQNNVPFDGNADFKFALVDTSTGTYFWSNDGTTSGEPTHYATLPVTGGVFSVLVGADPMNPIDPEVVATMSFGQALRVWVDLGDGFVLLGDQPLSSAPFAMAASSALRSPSDFVANGLIRSVSGGFRFPDGTIQTTAASNSGGGTNTLDAAYDEGGPGAGRTITADAGPVSISGDDGLTVSNYIHIGENPSNGRIYLNQVGSSDTTKLFAFAEGTTPSFFLESGYSSALTSETTLKWKSAWQPSDEPLVTMAGDGQIGFGVTDPLAPLHLLTRGNWDVTNGNGDFLIGNDTYKFKIGMATGGGGAGNVHMRATGGTNRIILGGGANDVLWVGEDGIEVTEGPFQIDDAGRMDLNGDFGGGQSGTALWTENTNAAGIAFWAKSHGTDATAVIQNSGTGDILRGFQNSTLKFRVLNSGEVVTPAMQITGGADLTETFDVSDAKGCAEPGSVLVIDEHNPGQLTLSSYAYDTRVAGVISGAGGVMPGLVLAQEGVLEGTDKVALSGRVNVRASAENGPIRPGDLLTTSEQAGVAMRATDRDRAFGAVLGKAMTGLKDGEGLVLVLIGLQ